MQLSVEKLFARYMVTVLEVHENLVRGMTLEATDLNPECSLHFTCAYLQPSRG
jgi:hypothetical protein